MTLHHHRGGVYTMLGCISYRIGLCSPIWKPNSLDLCLHDTGLLLFTRKRSAFFCATHENSERGSRAQLVGFACLHEMECGTGRIGSLLLSRPQQSDFTPQKRCGAYRIRAKPCKSDTYLIWELIRCMNNPVSCKRSLNRQSDGYYWQILLNIYYFGWIGLNSFAALRRHILMKITRWTRSGTLRYVQFVWLNKY